MTENVFFFFDNYTHKQNITRALEDTNYIFLCGQTPLEDKLHISKRPYNILHNFNGKCEDIKFSKWGNILMHYHTAVETI